MRQSDKRYLFIIFLFSILPFTLRAQQVNFTTPAAVQMHTSTYSHLYAYHTHSTGTQDALYQWKLINATDREAKSKKTKTGLMIAQVAVGALAAALIYPEIKELGRLKQVQKYGPYWDIEHDIFRQAVRTNIFIGVGVGVSVPLAIIRKRL